MAAHMAIDTAAARTYAGPLPLRGQEMDGLLRAAGSVARFGEGSEIFAEGDGGDIFYQVLSGVVRVCKFLPDGRRQIEAFHSGADVFGMERGTVRESSAEAVNDCTLVCYRRRQVDMLAQNDGAVARQLLRFAMENLAQARAHALLLGRRGAAEKLAAFLLEWSARSADPLVLKLAMTRQDIADYLGLTIETVSRTFSQFEREGLIALSGTRAVSLRERDILEEVAAR